MIFGVFQPVEQFANQCRDSHRRWSQMHTVFAIENAYSAIAEPPGIVYQRLYPVCSIGPACFNINVEGFFIVWGWFSGDIFFVKNQSDFGCLRLCDCGFSERESFFVVRKIISLCIEYHCYTVRKWIVLEFFFASCQKSSTFANSKLRVKRLLTT